MTPTHLYKYREFISNETLNIILKNAFLSNKAYMNEMALRQKT